MLKVLNCSYLIVDMSSRNMEAGNVGNIARHKARELPAMSRGM